MLSNLDKITAGKVKTSGVSPFNELEISKVFPNPDQPRKQFDDIEELAATIKEHGLLQPITVVKKDDRYMIIAGERRYKAHLYNEAKTIKAYIVDVSEEQVEELTLIENIQRNDLTDFELAKHICKLWDSGRYEKKSDLATRIGKSDSYVSKSFNCLKLDSEIIDHIEQNKTPISISVMDEIARVKDPIVQKEVYEKYSAGEITRDEIKDFKEPKKTIKEKVEEIFIKPPISCSYVEENFPRENSKKRWFMNDCFDALYGEDEKGETIGVSWYSTHAFMDYFNIKIPKDFPDTADTQRYRIIVEEFNKNELDETAALKQKIQELEKEIEELKKSSNKTDCILDEETAQLLDKEISKIVVNRAKNIFHLIDGKTILLDYEQSLNYFKNCKQKEFNISFIFESAIKVFKDEVISKLDNYFFNENENILTSNKIETIKIIEVCESSIYVEYIDSNVETISYSKAKELIKNSTQKAIPYTISSNSDKAYDFINKMPNRTQQNNTLVLKEKK